jgi:hypothetical protein
MSQDAMWRVCSYCKKQKYCSATLMRDHEEDCDQRPSLRAKLSLCPKCGSALAKTKVLYVCLNVDCDYELGVVLGGKVS